jgi:3-deoxy-D-manno-octulosonic-acid transferase
MFRYNLLLLIFAPVIIVHALHKAARFKSWRYFWQRMGFGFGNLPQQCHWLHCASVGEAITALPLVDELHRRFPNQHFLLTTNTPTGASIIARQSATRGYLHHAFLPIDWRSAVTRFLRRTQAARLTIIETELWPNLIHGCQQRGIKIVIANGRLSARTTIRNPWVRAVYASTLAKIDRIYARNEQDASAFIELGAAQDRVHIAGNLKFAAPAIDVTAQTLTQRDYVLLASSHANEELDIAQRWLALKRRELLVIAPRHPERSDSVQQQLQSLTPAIARRSRNDEITDSTRIYLLDTVGELMGWFAATKLIVMGGSFVPVGGHNILEAAHFGKGVLFGPHMNNFSMESNYLLQQGAAMQCDSCDALQQQLQYLLEHSDALQQLDRSASAAMLPYKNVVSEYADKLGN